MLGATEAIAMRERTDVRTTTSFDGKYLGLTTFKRDGTAVTTPVWFVSEGGRLLIETGADSYKVKRIGREPMVIVGLCSARGRMKDLPVPARAELLPDDQIAHVEEMMARKYRVEMLVFKPLRAIQKVLHVGPHRGKSVIVAIVPS
jgi:PPOX class probable F420-dependent enzyme